MASSNTAQSLIDAAEENFKSHNPEEAFRLAIMAKQLNPQFDAILDRFIASYGVHVAAARKNSNGDINWYAVLGIVDALTDIETIKKNYKKLALLVHPDKNTSVAAEGAFKLISEAWDVLSQPTASPEGAATYGARPSSAHSSSRAAASGSSSSTANSHAPPSTAVHPGFSTVTPAVCLFCGTHCVFRYAELVSITCPNCGFGFTVSSKRASKISFGNGGDANFSFKISRCS